LKQGEKISNLENDSQNLIHLPLTILQKDFQKHLQKEFAKTKHVVQAWSKMLKMKETIHAYPMRIYIGSILSNLCTCICKLVQLCTFIFALVCVGINHQKGGRLKEN
jgi:hypothetical protein